MPVFMLIAHREATATVRSSRRELGFASKQAALDALAHWRNVEGFTSWKLYGPQPRSGRARRVILSGSVEL